MVNIKRRIYLIGLVILSLVLFGVSIFLWNFFENQGKQQDKIYSGAKLVDNLDNPVKGSYVN